VVDALFDILEASDPPGSDPPGIILRVLAHPGAGRTAIVGQHGDALKLKVAAPPVDGRANKSCATLLASLFGVREAAVSVVSGESSRAKRFRIEGVAGTDAQRLLEQAVGDAAGPGGPRRRRP
jgi:uncharacterized protein (TIGR00251 family)